MVKEISAEQFDELIKGDKPVVCDFFATWCGPCRMLAPVLEQVSEEFADRANFVKVDVDQAQELAVRYAIMNIPYVGVFKNGAQLAKSVGYTPKSETVEFLEEYI